MKKIITLLLVFAFVFCLAACGNSTDNSTPNNTDGPSQSQGGNHSTSGTTPMGGDPFEHLTDDFVWAYADSATKAEFVRQNEAEGMTVVFGNDGTTTLTDEEGNKMVQNAQGVWTYYPVDGGQTTFGDNKWPDHELTRKLPKPDFSIAMVNQDENGYGIVFSDATISGMKAYAQKVASAGFANVINTGESDIEYHYWATNAEENYLTLTWADGMGVLGIYYSDPFDDDDDWDDDDDDWDDDGWDDDDWDDDDDNGGNPYDMSGEWPDNEFTRQLPKPDMNVYLTTVEGNEFSATLIAHDVNEVKAYVGQLKKSGFTVRAEELEQDVGGMAYYGFYAENSKGYNIELSFVAGSCILYLSK